MKFLLSIDCDNAAFNPDEASSARAVVELARILGRVAADLLEGHTPYEGDGGKVRDVNGNTVGAWEMVAGDYDHDEERTTLELCICGECYDCPDGWHSGGELPCSCTPDCALEDGDDDE